MSDAILYEKLRFGESDFPKVPFLVYNSNISIENSFSTVPKLSTQHRKSAFILKESVNHLADKFGLNYLGFLTLTFADYVTCSRESQKRLNSLLSNVIKLRYREYLGVLERHKSGRIHYHLLVVLNSDIRSGVAFDELSRGIYSSANSYLRSEWAFWRVTAKKYSFGRTELLPVKSSVEAMAKYVGKYIGKHIDSRKSEDKGVRLVRYSTGARIGTTRFMFDSKGSKEWRRKVATFAEIVKSYHPDCECNSIEDLSRVMGKQWAYRNRDFILSLP